jgi:translocator protein
MMAWSGWRVWSAPASVDCSRALRLWFSQLSPHAEWTKLLFGGHRPDLALADLVVLEAYVLGYMAAARKVGRAASQAFIPYAAWVAFAGLLNAE